MAVDAKIELFACELFSALWNDYSDECVNIPFEILNDCEVPLESEMSNDILKAVKCRRSMFYSLLIPIFGRDYSDFCDSTSDFYAYLRKSFPSNIFEKNAVMEQVLASCAYAVEMCIFATFQNNYLFVNKCHLVWAMYFDTELKPQFYAAGGWSALRRIAQPYILCYDFLTEHHHKCTPKHGKPFSLWPVEKNIAGAEEFKQFLQTAFTISYGLTLSTKFIHHCLADNDKPFPKTSALPLAEASSTLVGVENLLQYMKYMCDPHGLKVIEYDRKIARGEVPPRVFYKPKTGSIFIVDETQSKVLDNQYTKSLFDASDQSESSVEGQKRISAGKDCQEGMKAPINSFSPPNKKNLKKHKSLVDTTSEDDLQNNLGSILSELDINTTTPESTVSRNQYASTTLDQESVLKPARKRLSDGNENFHSQIPLSENLESKCSPAEKAVLTQRKIEDNDENRKTVWTIDEATPSLALNESKLQTKYDSDELLQESSTKVHQAAELQAVENKISSSHDEVVLSGNEINPDQIDEMASILTKMHPNPIKGNNTTEVEVLKETNSLNETKIPAEDQNEPVAYQIKDILRMILVLGSPPGIRLVRSTLHKSNK